ncbi:UDP-N-acetylglucosamine 1-carboxyvinyltransferase, partial [bacterium]|nr:UDP-N-acetylglucosamine 1-carboxyvinyltransferase [bacterium]
QEDLHGIEYTTIPDRIEAGTYMAAIIGTKGKGIIKNVNPSHLTFYTSKLTQMGAKIKLIEPTAFEVSCNQRLQALNIVTQPYPGFPTDLQSLGMALLSVANGVSIITESLYENRFMQVPELRKMGADIHQERNHALVKGVDKLSGANLRASDLRAGAALVLAALMAEGYSTIEELHHIDRGYELLVPKMKALGADISRINDETDIVADKVRGNLNGTGTTTKI